MEGYSCSIPLFAVHKSYDRIKCISKNVFQCILYIKMIIQRNLSSKTVQLSIQCGLSRQVVFGNRLNCIFDLLRGLSGLQDIWSVKTGFTVGAYTGYM